MVQVAPNRVGQVASAVRFELTRSGFSDREQLNSEHACLDAWVTVLGHACAQALSSVSRLRNQSEPVRERVKRVARIQAYSRVSADRCCGRRARREPFAVSRVVPAKAVTRAPLCTRAARRQPQRMHAALVSCAAGAATNLGVLRRRRVRADDPTSAVVGRPREAAARENSSFGRSRDRAPSTKGRHATT